MDVTSLLNENSTAVEQQRKMENDVATKAPSRNRTPWDAGGYSLPINTIPHQMPNTPPHYHTPHHDDSQHISASTPTSPRHKFSDSRSSVSSFTSSLQSATHSRFSSMSTTVSGSHLFNSFGDTLSPTACLKMQEMDLATSSATDSNRPQHYGSLSPTRPLDTLAMAAQTCIANQKPSTPEENVSTLSEHTPHITTSDTERPNSPSDAILIKRPTLPSLRVVTSDQELHGSSRVHLHNNFLSAPPEIHRQSLMHSRSHKRALSAPNFSANFSASTSNCIASSSILPSMAESMRPVAEPTPPTSTHPDIPSPTMTTPHPNSDTPPADESQEILCMYIPNCDTGSQLRKAISHIFGRNKMCTRKIPKNVWVHYCRKHYQRSRYRNPKEYAKLQCDLVQQQIRRVHEWSLNNTKNGVAGRVQDWGLAIRKREQKRLDGLGGSRKRSAATLDEDSDEGENGEEGLFQSPAVPATAVPEWLLGLCGQGYTTSAILEIFNRLHHEIRKDILPCFPDIEILPNITVDDEPKSPKGYTKRTPRGHKRAQSLGVGMKPNYQSQTQRRQSQPSITSYDGVAHVSPGQKRRRPNEMDEVNSPVRMMASIQESRFSEQRRTESSRRMPPQGHRMAFPNTGEHYTGENEYYGFSPQSQYQNPLPAPVAQRLVGQSMAAHLETNDEYSHPRRPSHNRSRSDIGGLARGRYEYGSVPETAYQPRTWHQESAQLNARSYPAPQPRYESQHQQYPEMRQSTQHPSYGHHRSQSSSVVQSSYAPAMPSLREHQTQASSFPDAGRRMETQDAQKVFTTRR